MRRARLARIAIAQRALGPLRRAELDRANKSLAMGRKESIAYLLAKLHRTEHSHAAVASVRGHVRFAARKAIDFAPTHVQAAVAAAAFFSRRAQRLQRQLRVGNAVSRIQRPPIIVLYA